VTYAHSFRSLARDLATAVLLVVVSSRCAIYDNSLRDGPGDGKANGGESAGGGKPSAGGTAAASGSTNGAAPGDHEDGGSTGIAGNPDGGQPNDGGTGGAEGGAPSEGGQAPNGGTGGAGGMAGTGGAGGTAGTGGTGGTGVSVLLSQGKPATSDSEQTSQNHLAIHANDGDTSTRWCAANSSLNHYLQVDLGEGRTLTKVHLLWEKDFAYLFKIETSADDAQWSMAIDKTTSSDASASQDHMMPANTKGRYVRLTVTGGLTASTWASLYEVEIFGY
jgi:hypothetical protein